MPKHYKITAQTIKWILKSGGFIFFEKEMSKPGEAIATKRNDHKPKPFAGDNTENQANENEQGAEKMQATACRISMLSQIIRIKTPKGLIFFFHN